VPSRLLIWAWVLGATGVLLPTLWLRSLWIPRELQYGAVLVVGLAAVSWLIASRSARGPLHWLGWAGLAVASSLLLHRLEPSLGMLTVGLLLGAGALVLVARDLGPRVIGGALACVAGAHLVVSLAQVVARSPRAAEITGLTDHRDGAGILLAATLPWLIVWLADVLPRRWSPSFRGLVLSAPVVLGALAIVAYRSFGGFLAFALAGALAAVAGSSTFWRQTLLPVSLAATTAAGGYWLLVDAPGFERAPVFRDALGGMLTWDWSALIGHGLGSWQLHTFGLGRARGAPVVWRAVHNDWLQVGYEVGPVVVGLLVLVAAYTLRAFWRAQDAPLRVAGLASAGAWLVGTLTFFPMRLAELATVGLLVVVLAQQAEAP